jgi:BirA family biotin operon repressor/biotin-[acetyl-CoA-carboxylase] ligase
MLEVLCSKLEKWYLKLKEKNVEMIDAAYFNHLFGLNETLSFVDLIGLEFNAKILGVTKKGKLMLEMDANTIREFDVKEVKLIL